MQIYWYKRSRCQRLLVMKNEIFSGKKMICCSASLNILSALDNRPLWTVHLNRFFRIQSKKSSSLVFVKHSIGTLRIYRLEVGGGELNGNVSVRLLEDNWILFHKGNLQMTHGTLGLISILTLRHLLHCRTVEVQLYIRNKSVVSQPLVYIVPFNLIRNIFSSF